MLTKAILTGGVLAVLSGSIVYFGTDGADALDFTTDENAAVEDIELAGAAVSEDEVLDSEIVKTAKAPTEKTRDKKKPVKEAPVEIAHEKDADVKQKEDSSIEAPLKTAEIDPIDTPTEEAKEAKPKTKWLDQYLKSSKSKKKAKTAPTPDAEEPTDALTDEDEVEMTPVEAKSLAIQAHEDGTFRYSDGTIVEDEEDLRHARQALDAISNTEDAPRGETSIQRKEIRKKVVIEMDDDGAASETANGKDLEIEMIEELLGEEITEGKKVRVIRLDGKTNKKKKRAKTAKNAIDYDLILDEARKLQVIDMRNIAFFEIIDYAIDRKNFGRAADILQELSDPELRDTARAKIGVGLAKTGDSEAAFAVLDEMEIDELTASMRLEIITALMATKAERAGPPNHR